MANAAACLTHTAEVKTDRRPASAGEAKNPFFSAGNMERLNGLMSTRRVKEGSAVFWEGDEAGKLYFIRSGSVKLSKSSEEGRDFILSIMNKGDLIGEIGEGPGTFYSYTATALQDTELGSIQISELEALLYRHGDLAVEFAKWLGLMHRTMQTKLRDLLLYGKPGALASTLIRMSNTCGTVKEDGIRLGLKLSNSEMADMIGATRESVNRMLNAMRDEGTISNQNGYLVIHRIEDLRKICNCPKYGACPLEICRL